MARNEPEPVVGCEGCGQVNEEASALLAQARHDIEGLERDLRGKRSRISQLEGERWEKLRRSKRYDHAMEVLRFWRDVCAPKAREIDSVERLAAVLARLNGGHTVEELKLAVTGYSKRPYVTRAGRAATGTKAEWFADVELICRTPEHVRKGIAWAEVPSSPTLDVSDLARLSWRQVQAANRKLIVDTIRREFGTEGVELGGGYLELPCPRCAISATPEKLAGSAWLVVYPVGMGQLVSCHVCGITEARLIAAITQEEQINGEQ